MEIKGERRKGERERRGGEREILSNFHLLNYRSLFFSTDTPSPSLCPHPIIHIEFFLFPLLKWVEFAANVKL